MSTSPRKEERRISTEHIVLSYCKGHLLYLIFRDVIDEDMPPLAGDFTIVDRARPVPVLDLKLLQNDGCSVVVLQLKDRIRSGHEIGILYKPTQWLMCWQDSGDEIGVFEQSVFPEGHNAVDLSKYGEPGFEDLEEQHGNQEINSPGENSVVNAAELGYVCDFRIQVNFNPGVDASRPPSLDDFRAEMHDRWLKLTSVKYFHVERGVASSIILALSEPMEVGSVIHLAYKSPTQCLATMNGQAIAPFSLEAVVAESPQSFIDDHASSQATKSSNQNSTRASHGSSSSLGKVATLHADTSRDLKSDDINGIVDADLDVDDLPLLDAVVDDSELVSGSGKLGDKRNDKSSNAANDEALAGAKEKGQETGKPAGSVAPAAPLVRDPLKEQTKESEQATPSSESEDDKKEVKIIGQRIDYSTITPSMPGGIANPSATYVKEEKVPNAPKEATALEKALTKGLYVAPIAIFAWVLLVVVVYGGYMIFGSGGASDAAPQAIAHQQGSSQQAQSPAQAGQTQQCEVTAEDGGVYKGECVNGVFEGHGVFTWPSGNKYDGTWKNGKQHGVGKLMYNNGAVYTGEFANGVEHGGGLMRWPNGSSYQGGYDKGIFHGQGEYKSVDGTRYVGRFERGMMTQEGTCFMKNGNQEQGPCGQGGRR